MRRSTRHSAGAGALIGLGVALALSFVAGIIFLEVDNGEHAVAAIAYWVVNVSQVAAPVGIVLGGLVGWMLGRPSHEVDSIEPLPPRPD